MGCLASRPSAAARAVDEKRALLAEWAQENVKTYTDTSARLSALRKQLAAEKLDAYIVPTEDAHASEYTAPCDQRREFISGFTGSAGMAIVLQDSAHLFTDGRYHIQAGQQLDDNWTLHKVGRPGVQDWPEWLCGALQPNSRVGIDATLIAYSTARELAASLASSQIQLCYVPENLVDAVWTSRPAPVLNHVYEHPLKYAGVPAADKLRDLRAWLQKQGQDRAYVLSSLDEIAWLLNLRGASIPCNPVFPAYAVVTQEEAALFVDARLVREVSGYLAAIPVSVHAYEDVWEWIRSLRSSGMHLYFHEKASAALVDAASEAQATILPAASVVALAKARKNETEQNGLRAAYMRDGAAWVRWAAWLDEAMARGACIDERQAADRFAEIRREDPLYAMESYDAISATGPNAALPHYETPQEHSRVIDRASPYLNDSGAQYHDGTIDTTRTVHFGTPSYEQKRAYTRVLQGHSALARARFPAGTTGAQLDMLARQPLFQDGYNYLHGTGHGIGSFLNVHEGPYGFSSSSGGSKTPVALEEGMAVSDEPGFYEEGEFGIRIESVFLVQKLGTFRDFGGKWLGFELLTRVPINTKMIDFGLLSRDEKVWLRLHNELVKRDLLPMVQHDPRAVRWLRRQ
ncbi:Xaa-Pro aminopeptidase [Malassezia obtusa]|uniref:Xaa-Pro aminopeptidase n=1 Tax=Malassezia obtusa TaxID=76774 RepID=A0AAF0IXQ2_9BASI|nr:Xaa-Pro aminopeptidase [Malassezia obtusa]